MRLIRMVQQQTKSAQSNKISTYLTLIVLVVFALSIVSLCVAVETYLIGDIITAGLFAGLGFIAMLICLFLLFQTRRQAAEVKLDIPKVMAVIEWQNKDCANKT